MAEETNFKKILFGMILTSLFAVLIIGSAVNFGSKYDMDTNEVVSALNYEKFNESVSEVEESSENLRQAFEKQSIWSSVAGIVVSGIFDVAKSMFLMVTYPFSLVAGLLTNVLHIPIIVSSVLIGMLGLAIIFGIWKLLKIGE